MGSRARSRGVTLVEMMIVVCIVAVLAVIALVAYRRWVHSSYIAEAQDIVSNVRQGEEAYLSENGVGYLNVSSCLGLGCTYPAKTPGKSKTAWGGPCGWCSSPTGWTTLGVNPSNPVIFGYAVVADTTASTISTKVGHPTVKGTAIDLSKMTAPWYFVEADANINGDGSASTSASWTHVYGMSGTNQIFVDEGDLN